MLTSELIEIGFSSREAKIYLALLSLWSAIVSVIARKTQEKRSTVYSVLYELQQKWIAHTLIRNKVTYYTVISPKKLLEREQKKQLLLEKIMPELLLLSESYDNKPKVYYYEWWEQLKEFFVAILQEKTKEYYTFVWTHKIDTEFEKYLQEVFVPLRKKSTAKTKAILSKQNSEYIKFNLEMHEAIVIKDPIFKLSNEIVLYGQDKIAIFNFSQWELYGVSVRSKSLFETLKSIFLLLWKTYKK